MKDTEISEAEEFEGENQKESAVDRLIRKYDMACKDLNIIKCLCDVKMDSELKIRSIKMILEQREND